MSVAKSVTLLSSLVQVHLSGPAPPPPPHPSSATAVRAIKANLDKPKTAPNGYTLYYQEKYPELRGQFPTFSIVDIGKRAGATWRALSEVEKKKYVDRAARINEQSQADRSKYHESLSDRQKLARLAMYYHGKYARGLVKRAEVPKDVKEFVKGLPTNPFETGRQMFVAQKLRGQKNAAELIATVSREWDSMPPAEKKRFEDRAQADFEAFKTNINAYINMS